MIRPSAGQDGVICATDLGILKSEIFLILGLDTCSVNQKHDLPVGQNGANGAPGKLMRVMVAHRLLAIAPQLGIALHLVGTENFHRRQMIFEMCFAELTLRRGDRCG